MGTEPRDEVGVVTMEEDAAVVTTTIGLFAGTNAFGFFPGRFVVVPEEDAVLELDVEGNRVRGFLDAATLALDATWISPDVLELSLRL